jgi:uncharacterized phage-associated protein
MTNGQTTKAFFASTTRQTVNMILDNIAKHYGILRAQALDEVTDADAEHLLDYVTGPERAAAHVIMQRHGF